MPKPKWNSYLCNVNDKLASIYLDLALREVAPVDSRPWLLWVWVDMRTPRPDGLSDSDEAPTLYQIEGALTATISASCRATLAGRITTDGRREFYFYGEEKDGFSSVAHQALSAFEGYRVDLGTEYEPDWNQYLNVLYPNPEELQRIGNRDVLDVMKREGDSQAIPREVMHWIFFETADRRRLFRSEAEALGYRINSEHEAETSAPYSIAVSRIQSIEQDRIDETVLELLRLAQRFSGEYDGWESPVMKQ